MTITKIFYKIHFKLKLFVIINRKKEKNYGTNQTNLR